MTHASSKYPVQIQRSPCSLGYLPEPDADDFGTLANGHEEINLEARRRHRQEKLPPLSPNAEAEAAAAAAEANPDQEDQEDAEKILTIEQAKLQIPSTTYSRAGEGMRK